MAGASGQPLNQKLYPRSGEEHALLDLLLGDGLAGPREASGHARDGGVDVPHNDLHGRFLDRLPYDVLIAVAQLPAGLLVEDHPRTRAWINR